MENYNLNQEWLDVVKLAEQSPVTKEEFAAFLEEKRRTGNYRKSAE